MVKTYMWTGEGDTTNWDDGANLKGYNKKEPVMDEKTLVQRLRTTYVEQVYDPRHLVKNMVAEAADEIERLEVEVKELDLLAYTQNSLSYALGRLRCKSL